MKQVMNLMVLVLSGIVVQACLSIGKPANFDYGHVKNGKYYNKYFHMVMDLPEGWVVQSRQQMDEIASRGKKIIAGNNKIKNAEMTVAEINVANLLGVFKYKIGSVTYFNPSISLVAENVRSHPDIKNGSDYLSQARKVLENSSLHYDSLPDVFKKEIINGAEFYHMDIQLTRMGIVIKQKYYATIIKGFSFNMIITYVNDDQKDVLLKSIRSAMFEQ